MGTRNKKTLSSVIKKNTTLISLSLSSCSRASPSWRIQSLRRLDHARCEKVLRAHREPKTDEEREEDVAMSKARVSVEWYFSYVMSNFRWLQNWSCQKVLRPVGRYFLIDCWLANLLTCAKGGNQTSQYFGGKPYDQERVLGCDHASNSEKLGSWHQLNHQCRRNNTINIKTNHQDHIKLPWECKKIPIWGLTQSIICSVPVEIWNWKIHHICWSICLWVNLKDCGCCAWRSI